MPARAGAQLPGPYLRRPLEQWAPKAKASRKARRYVGLEFDYVSPLVGNLCIRPGGGVDGVLYHALRTYLSIDDALDLAEIDNVDRSWRDAAHANAEIPSG